MRRSDTFRGDSRANRDDAVMARGTEKGEGEREGNQDRKGVQGRTKTRTKEDREGTWSEAQGLRRGKRPSTYYVTPLGCVNTTAL